ncbi:MAG: ion channel, partial [Bacteroidota bacterium]
MSNHPNNSIKVRLIRLFKQHFEEPEYIYLLLSILLLIMVPGFLNQISGGRLIMDINFLFVLLMGSIFTTSNFKELLFSLGLGLVIFGYYLTDVQSTPLGFLFAFLNLIFFGFIFMKLINFVLKEKVVDLNTVYACICGYFLLGIMATSVFAIIDATIQNAFTQDPLNNFIDLIYLSFITLTSVGYGDI